MDDINIIWIIISYVLGSMPFGYIITRLSTRKDVLKVGWRKTSGSNVYNNIGKWQGVLTGVLDLGKGFLAVRLAQNMGFSATTQALAGVAAVVGHNWSCFLKLAGGRGIGTYVGAGLALSSKILGQALVIPIILALTWDASLATIILLATVIFLSFKLNQTDSVGLFSLVSLIPIFMKRLSPIGEVLNPKEAKDRKVSVKNRLIFDDDIPHSDWRIKRVVKRLTGK